MGIKNIKTPPWKEGINGNKVTSKNNEKVRGIPTIIGINTEFLYKKPAFLEFVEKRSLCHDFFFFL